MIQGIVQEINITEGTMLIRTKDGIDYKVKLTPASSAKTNTGYVEVANLEPGLSVQVNTERTVARLIDINLAQLDGNIVKIDNTEITLQPLGSNQLVTLRIKPFSIVRQLDQSVTLNFLKVGRIAKAYFNTVSRTVYEINEMPDNFTVEKTPEGSRIEGVISTFRLDALTINTFGGKSIAIRVDSNTKIILPDKSYGTTENLTRNTWIRAYFSPVTKTAWEIQIEPTD